MPVEVRMQEDGLRGSKYCAQVLEVRQLAALVQYNELHEEGTDEDGRQILTEYVAHGLISPVPAPPPPGWLEAVEIETLLEVLYEGGWYVIATPLPPPFPPLPLPPLLPLCRLSLRRLPPSVTSASLTSASLTAASFAPGGPSGSYSTRR